MYFIYLIGTAGSGKSSMTKTFGDWIEDHEMSVARVNLDPAVEVLPYSPDVDVRDYVNFKEILNEGLGPNGALIKAVDLMLLHADRIRKEIEATESNYVLIDTPGQLELFAFRRSTLELFKRVTAEDKAALLYLIDPSLFISEGSVDPYSFVSALLLGTSVRARMRVPTIFVISKVDLLSDEIINTIEMWLDDPTALAASVSEVEILPKMVEAIGDAGVGEVLFASALSEEGLDNIYAALQRALAGGEDYATEEPSARL
ncbi:MAG: GTPase [Crenarchaeota archaeon]|nr:GTPase [Thermoproteota archaeon]